MPPMSDGLQMRCQKIFISSLLRYGLLVVNGETRIGAPNMRCLLQKETGLGGMTFKTTLFHMLDFPAGV